jgi:integron integrase
MEPIPPDTRDRFNNIMKRRNVAPLCQSDYRKWLRYFLDFRAKYPLPEDQTDQVKLFAEKLRSKNQTAAQVKQAIDAISLYFSLRQENGNVSPRGAAGLQKQASPGPGGRRAQEHLSSSSGGQAPAMVCEPPGHPHERPLSRWGRRYDEWRCLRKTASPAWDAVIEKLAEEIKVRHYSRKTLKHYADWCRKFQSFLKDKAPEELTSQHVKEYLTHLAVKENVSSSHQNLAFNSLLFLYRHILKKDFGDHKDVPRAKTSNYIPTVLSRREIDSVLVHLRHPFRLVAQLQYGCGLRISEGCQLRVNDFDFEAGLLTVRGKGKKVRTVPLPKTLYPALQAQLEAVRTMHAADLATGFKGVFLDDQLEKKYPRAAKELVWQWFFPQESLTFIAQTSESRRYHMHDSRVQEALYQAVGKAGLTKRVTSHTFRHSYATHLLQAGYDIRTIQKLLGHSDVRTTMVYTHCLPSRPEKELKSPLDF